MVQQIKPKPSNRRVVDRTATYYLMMASRLENLGGIDMYVTYGTTQKQIKAEIRKINEELSENRWLTVEDRIVLHEELDYLESFLPKEVG